MGPLEPSCSLESIRSARPRLPISARCSMRAPRYASIMPAPERNPLGTLPLQSYPRRQGSDSNSDTDLDASGDDESSAGGGSASEASSAVESDASSLEEEEEEEEEKDDDNSDLEPRLYSSRSSRSSSVSSSLSWSSDGDELDGRADFFLDKAPGRRARSPIDLQDEPSMFPAAMRSDNIGVIAWLIPITGVATMVGTEILACVYHFQCADNFPTLSYAATFKPEGHAFTVGMCVTAILIFVSIALFFWFLKLRGNWHAANSPGRTQQQCTAITALVSGVLAAVSLFGLAVLDMRNYHDAHITFTILFFVAAWATIISVHQARRMILHENDAVKGGEFLGSLSSSSCAGIGDSPASLLSSLRRWKRLKFATAYTLGKYLLLTGLASTFLCK
jgi:hypothetical protein